MRAAAEYAELAPTRLAARVLSREQRASAEAHLTRLVPGDATAAGRRLVRFPGPLCVTLESRHRDVVAGRDYLVCEKTDGVRYLLAFLRGWDSTTAVLVDRRTRMFAVSLGGVGEHVHEGTVLDGELCVARSGRAAFLAFDALACEGDPVWDLPLPARLARAETTLAGDGLVPRPDDAFAVAIKTFTRLGADPGATRRVVAEASREFETDGLVLTPAAPAVVVGRHDGAFKIKPDHTIDFRVAADGVGLQLAGGERVAECASRLEPGAIAECSSAGNVWRFVRYRGDKTRPNDATTFRNTLATVRDAVTLEQAEAWRRLTAPERDRDG